MSWIGWSGRNYIKHVPSFNRDEHCDAILWHCDQSFEVQQCNASTHHVGIGHRILDKKRVAGKSTESSSTRGICNIPPCVGKNVRNIFRRRESSQSGMFIVEKPSLLPCGNLPNAPCEFPLDLLGTFELLEDSLPLNVHPFLMFLRNVGNDSEVCAHSFIN